MRSLSSSFSIPLVLLILLPAAFATMVCEGGDWAAVPDLAIDLRFTRGKHSGDKIGPKSCTPNVFYDMWSQRKPKITRDTRIPEDGRMQKSTTGSYKYTCDHLVELHMVKRVMEQPNGACDKALALVTAGNLTAIEAQNKLSEIRKHTFSHSNLFMVDFSAEKTKGKSVASPATTLRGLVWHKINELYSLVFEGPGTGALGVAEAIDREIHAQFRDASEIFTTVALWKAYIVLVREEWRVKKADAEEQVCRLKNAAPRGTTPRKRRAPTLPARMLRRHLTPLTQSDTAPAFSAFSPVVQSSLTTRARKGAARSGKNAPPGRCCPASKGPRKTKIPRSKVKTAAPPATKPRKPSQRPAPRAANAKKQVAKRPASRARREVGKPKVQKRTTPRRKPKVVPKATQRPRGKPRQRRRRR